MKKMLVLFFTVLSFTAVDINAMDKEHTVAAIDNLNKFNAEVTALTNEQVARLIEVLLGGALDNQYFTIPLTQQKIDLVIATINHKQIPYQATIETLLLLLEHGPFAQDHCIRWVKFLLSHGVNVNTPVPKWVMGYYTLQNLTPLAFVIDRLCQADSNKETLVKIAQILLQHGANPNHNFSEFAHKEPTKILSMTPLTLTENVAKTQPKANNTGYNTSISYAQQLLPMLKNPALANAKPTYMNYQALMKAAATTGGIYAVYHWITNKWHKAEPGQPKDVLFNKTGLKITVLHRQGDTSNSIELETNETFDLPMAGTLTIESKTSKKSLVIELDHYQTERQKRYLNLVISKNWLSWLFGPFKKTENWIAQN